MTAHASAAAATSDPTAVFEAMRPRLLGLAYRMLGTLADAEDVVQDAWIRWQAADIASLDNPDAWLTTVTTRLALDRMRAAGRRREDYVGPWLPEPLVVIDSASAGPGAPAAPRSPEDAAELSDSLTFGFLTMLDQLGPVERAVFLLADVFAVPYAEVSAAVGRSEVACRQIASRARRRLRDGKPRQPTHGERRVVDELLVAMAMGDVDAALARLAPDVVLVSDGGPTKRAARRPVVGADRVARLFQNLTKRLEASTSFQIAIVNGDPGIVMKVGEDVDQVMAFEVDDDGRVAAIWVVRNPEKLEHVMAPVTLT